MSRKYIDCREYPSESGCSVVISADSEEELLEVATQHAIQGHGHSDNDDLRAQLKRGIKSGIPPA